MTRPDVNVVTNYLAGQGDVSWPGTQVNKALQAEIANQAKVCRVPATPDDWDTSDGGEHNDLAEALCRRVARNLALRGLPLGLQSTVSEAAVGVARVGGSDPEIRRLESRYRQLVLG